MKEKEKYIRIGTSLYKVVQRPLISGDYIEEKILWSYETLRQDYGKNNLPEIEKYNGFCIIPDHVNYRQVHGTYLNQYEPINHIPCQGEFPYIRSFLEHIFGEQIELGLDYLQILYSRPTQMLPILLLVSNERNTGKTTFLRFLKMIFGKNTTFNTNEDFRSQFNSDWAHRLLVLVDELLLNKMEDTEKIKNLSTAGDYKIEAKGKDRREIEFFAKFVLCSNKVEMEMAAYCRDVMERLGQDKILCCPKDFMDMLRDTGLRADLALVRNILKDSWGLRSGNNGDYTFYRIDIEGELFPMKRKGRYLEVVREDLDKTLL